MRYCLSPFFYSRRKTREVVVGDPKNGGVIIGGNHPVVMQSMITCDTMDTAECVKQTLELVAVGCQIVRITAPTVKDAANLQNIVAELRARGLPRADCGGHPFQAGSGPGSGEVGGDGAHQSRQLRRLQEVCRQGIHRRAIRRRTGAHRGEVHAAGAALQGAGPRAAHRHQPRLAERPHHEPLSAIRRWAWSRARWNSPASPASTTSTISSSR